MVPKLNFLIFFITSQCDSNCPSCFYRDSLRMNRDLSLEEIELIAKSLGPFRILLLSGGEPFLRDDLPQLVSLFIKHSGVGIVSIPTNGLNPVKIASACGSLLKDNEGKRVRFTVTVSLDALEQVNAGLRGRHDAFSKAVESLNCLSGLRAVYPALTVNVNTVYSTQSVQDVMDLIDYVSSLDFVDFHNLEIVRPAALDGYVSKKYDIGGIERLHTAIAKSNLERLVGRLFSPGNPVQRIKRLYKLAGAIGYLRYQQRIQVGFLKRGRGGVFVCPGGDGMWVLEPDGNVRPCELRPPVGNVRANGYDCRGIFSSVEARNAGSIIRESRCGCTHTCFISESINVGLRSRSIKTYFLIVWHFVVFIACNGFRPVKGAGRV